VLVRHAAAVAPTRREDSIRVDAEVLLNLGQNCVCEGQVRIARVRPAAARFAIARARAGRTILLPIGGDEDDVVAGEIEQVIVPVRVHLLVVSVELMPRENESVRFGIVVVRRHIHDVPALHAAGSNRDGGAVIVLAARDSGSFSAAGGRTRAAGGGARAATHRAHATR